ncbi:MAG: 5-methylcytosine restriction system specificity protein McrC, partial [Solirubrobacteraceae bacterium]
MIERIELAEYETKRVSITRTDAALLRSLAGRRLGVQPTEESGCYELTAGSHVGTIRLPTTHLIVRPKVSMANLFHLLEADGDPLTVGKELVAYETDADLLPAFASVYTHLQERTLARGLRHEYQEREELLVGVRGRFDVAGQQRRAGLPLPTACRFDEYTPDTVWNRTLRAATERLARLPGVAAVTRRNLFRHLVMLEEVGPLAPGDRAHPLTFTRLDAHYRAAVQLARL